MIKYYNTYDYIIEKLEVKKDLAVFLITADGKRIKKETSGRTHKDTPEEVYLYMEEILQDKVKRKKAELEYAEDCLKKMRKKNKKMYIKFKKRLGV